MITLKSTRTSQPQGRAEIDWGNPITKDLVFATSGMDTRDAVSGVMGLPIGNGAQGAIKSGTGIVSANTANSGWYWPLPENHPLYTITTQHSALLLCNYVSSTAYANLLSIPYGKIWGSPYYSVTFFATAYEVASLRFNLTLISSGRVTTPGPNPFFKIGKEIVYATTRNATILNAFSDGVKSNLSMTTGSYAIDFSTKQPLCLFNKSNLSPGEGTIGNASAIIIFKRALSDKEIASLSANPWQIFK